MNMRDSAAFFDVFPQSGTDLLFTLFLINFIIKELH